MLVGTARRGPGAHRVAEHLDELARLADTAGALVVGRLTQRLEAPKPASYIGAGKVAELRDAVQAAGATLVVFDEELSPAQGKNLEAALGVRVMDRAELILDIFARRARSREAKMQVELAQLEYLLPRLARMWVHLSRIRGGIGLRGPGETQLETDRRMIRRRITTLKRKLQDVERHRRVIRAGRRAIPTAALVGYTNAGKSSLLAALTGARAFIEDRLFATLDTMTRELKLDGRRDPRRAFAVAEQAGKEASLGAGPRVARWQASRREGEQAGKEASLGAEPGAGGPEVRRVRLVDTVGFIRKLPHHLVASFRATLEEARDADLLLHVIDASHPDWEEQLQVVDGVLADLARRDAPLIHVFNKADRLGDPEAFRSLVASRYPTAVLVSALRGEVEDLLRALELVTEPAGLAQ